MNMGIVILESRQVEQDLWNIHFIWIDIPNLIADQYENEDDAYSEYSEEEEEEEGEERWDPLQEGEIIDRPVYTTPNIQYGVDAFYYTAKLFSKSTL